MASLASEIPLELMRPDRKFGVIRWIRDQGVPFRIRRKILQDWGDSLHVDLNTTDYDLLDPEVKI